MKIAAEFPYSLYEVADVYIYNELSEEKTKDILMDKLTKGYESI